MPLLKLYGLLAITSLTVFAAPSPSYPFNNQLPPVARYGEEYQYQIPSDTFTTTDTSVSGVNYSAVQLPPWLSFNNQTLTFSGTPPSQFSSQGDQTIQFILTGSDSTGSTNSSCQLQLSSSTQPKLSSPDVVNSVLSKSGPLADGNSVVVKPGENFNIQFPQSLFQDDRKIISYSGLTTSHSPLPIWINFDSSTLTFSGVSPSINSQIAPAEVFGVALIMSDYNGFASAELDFQLVIGAHQFTIDFVSQQINATVGEPFEYDIPLGNITLDGQPSVMQNISLITINNTASWISLDSSNGSISGTPPSDSQSVTVQVTINDSFDDSVSYNLLVNVQGTDNIFNSSSLNPVNATRGEFFEYDVSSLLLNKDVTLSASSNPTNDWLNFNTDNNTFTGVVPNSFQTTVVTLTANTGSKKRDTVTATFTINGVDEKSPQTSSTSAASTTTSASATASASSTHSSTPTTTTTPTNTAVSTTSHSGVSSKTVAILCGVLIPVGVIIAALLLFFCCRRRKRSNSPDSSSPKLQISGPILPEDDIEKKMMEPVYPVKSIGSGTTTTATMRTPDMTKDNKLEVPAPSGLRNVSNPNWEDSPQRASTFNFLRIDGGHEDDDEDDGHNVSSSSADTHVGDDSFADASENIDHTDDSGPILGQALTLPGDDSVQQRPISDMDGRPRNSWRQTNASDKRWQEHQSLGSLATISTDELLTVRLVDRDSGISSQRNSHQDPRDSFMEPTKSRILTPHHSFMPSDGSSTILKPIGSHSSTLQGHSQSNSVAYSEREIDPAPPLPNLHPLQEETRIESSNRKPYNPNNGTKSFYGLDSESISTDYRTASSGDDYEDELEGHSSEGEVIRPYRNSHGELTWNQVPRDESSDFVSMNSSDEYSGGEDDHTEIVESGPSRFSSSTARRNSRRDNGGKLVNFTKKGDSSQNNHNLPVNDNSLSGELAFL